MNTKEIIQKLAELDWVDEDLTLCPKCLKSWTGNEIPEEYLHFYNGKRYYHRLIGVEIPGFYDGVAYWECPDCKTKFRRFDKEFYTSRK